MVVINIKFTQNSNQLKNTYIWNQQIFCPNGVSAHHKTLELPKEES